MVEAALARLGRDDCPATAAELARLFRFIPGLLAQVHAIVPRLNATAVTQFRCPVGRLSGALDLVCAGGCPWACGDPAVPDRRAEFEPLRPLLAECATVLRTSLGQGQGGLAASARAGDSARRGLRRQAGRPWAGQERPQVTATPRATVIPALAIFPACTLVSYATLREHVTDH
jgi:hypothetical protein